MRTCAATGCRSGLVARGRSRFAGSARRTAAPQSREWPGGPGRRRHEGPPAVRVTGVPARPRERGSGPRLAAAGVGPPTSTPATLTPSGSVAGEPENARPRATATSAIAPTATATRRHSRCRGLRRLRVREGDRLPAKGRIVAAVAAYATVLNTHLRVASG